MRTCFRLLIAAAMVAAAGAAHGANALRFGAPANVSQSAAPTEKAKLVRLAYRDGGAFRKAWVIAYGDGPYGRQNVYARYSFDEGTTWSAPVLLSRDGAGAPTGGQTVSTRNALAFVVDNDKPSLFAPPVTSGPLLVVAWNSGYCPHDPAARRAGSYSNALQGAADLDSDGVADRPFHCVWVATTTDPALATWDVQQLTNGARDAINEVIGGASTGDAFAMAWQEDPEGLQPGEAEGRGDGGSGSVVSGGTNIWYTHAPVPDGALLRANIVQLSDNDARGQGQPGASRPSLQLSGSTAVVAYEESACPGGRCILYHAFPYAAPDRNRPGTIVSDVTRNARRVRLVLQGAAAAGGSNLRAVLLWRESALLLPGAPADIVLRRGLVDPIARPGSTGLLPEDILADAPQPLTQVAASGGNANAHRAVVRGSFIGVAYDLTPAMHAADPGRVAVPTANYNLYFTRSLAAGAPGSWSTAVNLSQVASPAVTVVEPRLVQTPASVVNPFTGTPDPGDAQAPGTLYLSYATEANTLAGDALRIVVARSTDQGATFERFVPLPPVADGQSEAQLRPSPDGMSVAVLWMGEAVRGDPASKEAMFATATAVPLADLVLAAAAGPVEAGAVRTIALTLQNRGTGTARDVSLFVTLPPGLAAVGISEPPVCRTLGEQFRCSFASLAAGATTAVAFSVTAATEGSYLLAADAASDYLDADPSDNRLAFTLTVTAPLPPPTPPQPPPPEPVTPPGVPAPGVTAGGGCSTAPAGSPLDPTLLVLLAVGLAAPMARRSRAASRD